MISKKDPNDPITIRVKYTNIVARTESLLKSFKHYVSIFASGTPENNYNFTECVSGYEKEAFRIAIETMNKQIKNPVTRIIYRTLDDETMKYVDAWSQIHSEAYRTFEGRKKIDELIAECDLSYSSAMDKATQTLTKDVISRLFSRRSEVKSKLEFLQQDIRKLLGEIKAFSNTDLIRTKLDYDDKEVKVLPAVEIAQKGLKLINLEKACNHALEELAFELTSMSYTTNEELKYNAEQAIVKSLHYRFSRGKRQRDPEIEEAISQKPKTKSKTADEEMSDLIKQLTELQKQKDAKKKQTPPTGRVDIKGAPKKKK